MTLGWEHPQTGEWFQHDVKFEYEEVRTAFAALAEKRPETKMKLIIEVSDYDASVKVFLTSEDEFTELRDYQVTIYQDDE